MKGSVILSETMLETTAILISFILIVLVVQLVFSQQNQRTYESVFEALGRDVSTSIDRAAATAGNIQMQIDIPKGLRFRLDIDQKALIIKYGDKNSVRTFFSSLIKSGPYSFENPKSLCIVKTVNDNSVYISNKTCSCNTNDNICDPECNVENKCDTKCVNDNSTGVCNPFCAKENPGICDKNCYRGYQTGVCEKNCIKENERDGICSPDCEGLKKGVCDLDCYDQYPNSKTGYCDPDCPAKSQIIDKDGVKYKVQDGKCYTGCINTTASTPTISTPSKITLLKDGICDLDCKDSKNICDPDCPDSRACQNVCTKENQTGSDPCCAGLVACPGDNICRKDCCGNGRCEWRPGTQYGWPEGYKTKWETNYTCPQDCGQATQPSCQTGGPFTSSACYEDVFQGGTRTGDKPSWQPGTISICDSEVKKFLDRRNWDINEVIKTIRARTPEGWAFDASRYIRACQRLQPAGFTISANENYKREDYTCCCLSECPDDRATYIGSECCGVGYCADHASAVLSVLRTLGVPAKDAYTTFDIAGDCRRHAFVVMKCDPDLQNQPGLWPNECNGNANRWLRLDATGQFVTFLDQTDCDVMCIWWNDKGLYALNDGISSDGKSGYAVPPGVRCGGNWNPSNSRCKQTNVDCHIDELCALAGVPQGFKCIIPGA